MSEHRTTLTCGNNAYEYHTYEVCMESHSKWRSSDRVGEHVPGLFVGHIGRGAAHTLLEQRPYRQFLSAVQVAPTAPPVLSPRDETDVAVRLKHIELESPTIPKLNPKKMRQQI